MDIVFIIDGSGSIRDANPADGSFDNWELLLTFVADGADQLAVSASGTNVAAVLFSDKGQMLFPLSQYTDPKELRNAILDTPYPGSNTNTSGGLYIAMTQVFTAENGDRPEFPNLALVFTDGKSTYDHEKTIPYAEEMKKSGVEIITVGITSSIDEVELKAISSPPQELNNNYFTTPSFQELGSVMRGIMLSSCVVAPTPTIPESKSSYVLLWCDRTRIALY